MTSGELAQIEAAPDCYLPIVLNPAINADRALLDRLRHTSERAIDVHDTIHAQLRDLLRILHPSQKPSRQEEAAEFAKVLGGLEPDEFGRWVYFPWSRRLVHVLPPDEFRLVRSDRNRLKITETEQACLAKFVIGVVGLSVGNAVARTLSLEALCGHLRLADHDTLDLSNLNRLQAGIHDLGVNKSVIAARQIYETDPFAAVEAYDQGLSEANLDEFLLGPPRLNLLIDECDGLDMKLRMRERARELRIPVIMETSDRGMLDVERFDLEPERPVLHGRVGGLRASELAGLETEDKVQHVLKILAPDELSARMGASMVEINRTVTTWPQLASEVQLGGASVATAVRRLALGLKLPSGRRYIVLDDLVADPASDEVPPVSCAPHIPCPPEPEPELAELSPLVRWLAEHAALAPSGGNAQPWKFVSRSPEELVIVHDEKQSHSLRDSRGLAAYFAIGAAAENADIASQALGRSLSTILHPPRAGVPLSIELRCNGQIVADPTSARAQLELVRSRATNRACGDGRALRRGAIEELRQIVCCSGLSLEFVTNPASRAEIGMILGAFDRIQFTAPAIHCETVAELRWSEAEARQTRDGIDIANLAFTPSQLAGLHLIRRQDVVSLLRAPGRGRALEKMAQDAMQAASAIALLRTRSGTPEGFVEAGRVMQRVWLKATELGLGIHPWTGFAFIADIVTDARREIFEPNELAELHSLYRDVDRIFSQQNDWRHVMLFRISEGVPLPSRSIRRTLPELFRPAGC